MTLILSGTDYWNLIDQAEPVEQNENFDEFDITRKYPFGQGYYRQIQLRDEILLDIANYQQNQLLVVERADREHPLEFLFALADCRSQDVNKNKKYFFSGSGMAPESTAFEKESLYRIVMVNVHINPEVFHSFAKDKSGELPSNLRHLIRRSDQLTYERRGIRTPEMVIALQQILQCPYQGMTKEIYLESKVWELMALILEQEIQINQGSLEINTLRPSEVDRIHYAREILLKQPDNPPSLIQLARQVGLNDCTLKLGFRHCFGTTVFGYLHNYRMQLAHKLLVEGNMNVTEVAFKVGYSSLPSFSKAFHKKFGLSPKSCQR